MKNELALKVYDIDYSFIIKNYLIPELWEKTWTLFVYKNVRVTLDLCEIATKKPIVIRFRIKIQDENYDNSLLISHDTDNSNINVLKRQINGAIRDLINYMERYYIRQETGYKDLERTSWDEDEKLREIAESYLDENNITLSDVRDAYIDKYVSDNAKGNTYLNNYIDGRKYKRLTDLWLVFYKAINDDEHYESIVNQLHNENWFDKVLIDIKEYIDILSDDTSDKYNDYFSEMEYNLEGI